MSSVSVFFSKLGNFRQGLKSIFSLDYILHSKSLYFNLINSLCNDTSICLDPSSDFVVSLTTYGERIFNVALTIESIMQQSYKANRIILWLDEEEFDDESLPWSIVNLRRRGLEVKYCKNYKSYKKLIPLLLEGVYLPVVTIDDDILYPYNFLERFFYEYNKNPEVVLCYRAHKITFSPLNKIKQYKDWSFDYKKDDERFDLLPTGNFGILYPLNSLSKEVLNIDAFTELAPQADDLWFKLMTLSNNKKCKVIKRLNMSFVDNSLDCSTNLSSTNVDQGGNDIQILNLDKKYDFVNLLNKEL